jgi:APA family basic amino acid/polyamine antiporter
MSFLTRRTAIDGLARVEAGRRLKPTLSWPHLIALGIGGIVGTGIYTLTGVGAERAGPAVVLAFAACGVLCLFAALAYAELATLIPTAGSAYTYTYAVLGETLAWVVGWSLILEYSLTCSAVAVGWSNHAAGLLHGLLGVDLPAWMAAGPSGGGLINLPAVFITLVVTWLLTRGAREGATVTIVLVIVKLVALAVFIALTVGAIEPQHFHPFMPYGFAAHTVDDHPRGVMAAAAVVFFAFFGFDAVSTSSEEVKNPKRDLTIGIIGSMAACTVLYVVIAACAVGSGPFQAFAVAKEPLAFVLRSLGHPQAAIGIEVAAVLAFPSVILVFMYGQTRVFFVMARDGLLPRGMSNLNAKTGSPVGLTLGIGLIIAVISGFFKLGEIAEMANAGTLLAFLSVAVCVMVLRVTRPDLPRVFRTPLVWVVAPLAVAGCAFFMFSLPAITLERFAVWNVIGLVVYLIYGRRKSMLAKAKAQAGA